MLIPNNNKVLSLVYQKSAKLEFSPLTRIKVENCNLDKFGKINYFFPTMNSKH